MSRACSMNWKRYSYRILVGNPEENIPLGRHRRICEDNTKMYPREIGWGGVD
jgi:hypothetical protein